ncbi:hypothetical protein NSK_001218 [Nannochloropsis salina CCMP1776]|uniref:Uncharacterized protein n=1 Tax=Nannochloropsis salina CCMP1776 TaxID=1027361 RepID=A0A4D9D834_9STRA|nr:hypothetical protein NSK_001218 [Nannochloropsis salina CCMP1776]|eukprot:TFJ87871.1 hypothetical protein NSK_001218 [Nannochloropsis salina CCMP1776]
MLEPKQPSASLATMSNKKKKKGGDEEGGGDASKNAWYIKILDAPPGLLAKGVSEDQQAKFQAIGHRYNVEYNRRAARQAGDLHRKIKLKQEAINALPEALQKEARTLDLTPFPASRRITTLTPPIPGFEAGKYDLPGAI